MARFPVALVSVQIMFRLQTPTGYALSLRTIPSPDIQRTLGPHEVWFDAFHWYAPVVHALFMLMLTFFSFLPWCGVKDTL